MFENGNLFLSFPERRATDLVTHHLQKIYKSVMRRVLRRHSRGLLDKLFGETNPLPVSRRRTSHSPHICNRNRMQKMCVYRSSKKLHVKNPRRKEMGLVIKKRDQKMPMSVIKTTATARMRCNAKCKSLSSHSSVRSPAGQPAVYWRLGGTHWE
jgi:hypothetical protein